MLYLYGLVDADHGVVQAALTGLTGLQGPLEVVRIGPWVLVCSAHEDSEIMPKRRLMLAHTKILETLLPLGTVLPARFGLLADSLEDARRLIEARSDLVGREFDKVRGGVEIGVRISYDRQLALQATLETNKSMMAERDALARKGAEAHYAMVDFGGRLADQLDRRRGAAQHALLAHLTPLSRDHVLRAPEEDTEVLRAEFLIDAPEQQSFEAQVQRACDSLDFAPGAEPSIQLIGPVPMYNFVRLTLATDPVEEAA